MRRPPPLEVPTVYFPLVCRRRKPSAKTGGYFGEFLTELNFLQHPGHVVLPAPAGAFCGLTPAKRFLLATRKRAGAFPHCQLIAQFTFFKLILDVTGNFFVLTWQDIYSSTWCMIDCDCHLPSGGLPVGIFVQLSGCIFLLPKGIFFPKHRENYYTPPPA